MHRWQSSDRNAAWGWNRSSSPWAVNYQCQDGAGHMDSHVSALSSRQSGEGVEEEWAHILTMTQNQPSVQVRVTSLRRSLTCEVTERRDQRTSSWDLFCESCAVYPGQIYEQTSTPYDELLTQILKLLLLKTLHHLLNLSVYRRAFWPITESTGCPLGVSQQSQKRN